MAVMLSLCIHFFASVPPHLATPRSTRGSMSSSSSSSTTTFLALSTTSGLGIRSSTFFIRSMAVLSSITGGGFITGGLITCGLITGGWTTCGLTTTGASTLKGLGSGVLLALTRLLASTLTLRLLALPEIMEAYVPSSLRGGRGMGGGGGA